MSRRVLGVLLAASLFSATGLAQDRLTVGSRNVSSPGIAEVPVYLLDQPGTALDGAYGHPIRGVLWKVGLTPGAPALDVRAEAAGVLSSATLFHQRTGGGSRGAWVFAWLSAQAPNPFSVGGSRVGDRIATLRVTVPPGLSKGTRIDLVLDPSSSWLASGDGRTVEVSWGNPTNLRLVDGALVVGSYWGDATGDGLIDVFDLVTLASYLVGNVSQGQAPFLAQADAMNLNPASDGTVDVLDLVLLAGHLVGNVPALPVP